MRKVKRILISVPEDYLEILDRACNLLGMNRSALFRMATYYFLYNEYPNVLVKAQTGEG